MRLSSLNLTSSSLLSRRQASSHGARSRAALVVRAQTAEARMAELSAKYNLSMKSSMAWGTESPYEYRYERGLYYHEIEPGVLVGTQPRHSKDVQELFERERITHVISLTEDKDSAYWGVNLTEVESAMRSKGITCIRRPAKDFDGDSLRKQLPSAVAALVSCLGAGNRTYVHCVAGLGRSPAVVIAYLYWFTDMDLDEAYKFLTSIRPCGPKRDAIRGATCDLVKGHGHYQHDFAHMHSGSFAVLNRDQKLDIQRRIYKMAGMTLPEPGLN